MEMKKILFKGLPDESTPVSPDNLNKLQDNVEEYANTKLSKLNIITGVEFQTGNTIDGKPEYGMRINIGALPRATAKYVNTNLSNVLVHDYDGIAYSANAARKIPFATVNGSSTICVDISISKTGGTITVTSNYDYSAYTEAYITIYYTKNS